jgi:hypothetical protein
MEQLCPLLRGGRSHPPGWRDGQGCPGQPGRVPRGLDRLCRDGYGDVVISVWQARPAWDSGRDAADNGRLAAHDPALRAYVDRAPVVAVGGLVRGPCPRATRHVYLAELVRAFPDTRFWALGQLVGDVNV